MKRGLPVLVVLCLIVAVPSVCVPADSKPSPPNSAAIGPTTANPWLDKIQATAMVRDYLQRMKIDSTVDNSKDYPVVRTSIKMTNATHHVHIAIDTDRWVVYIFLNRYLSAKPDSAVLPRVLQRLMEENWNLNIGKFEWDKSDGEIRYSYCFTTENGIGYEAFEAIVSTLTETGDRLWPELRKLTDE